MLSNSDFKFTLSVSTKNYACKPSGDEMRGFAFKPLQLTIESALQCANQGKAFCYTFRTNNADGFLPIGQKTAKNFISTSTIIYDFDDMEVNMTDYISLIPYKPSFAYPTYSDGKNGMSRFRLAYVFDNEIQGEENFEILYHAIANANQFVKETKEHGGWDVRNVAQMYYGTTLNAKTYKSDYIYNLSDFEQFCTSIPKEEKSKIKQSKKLDTNKYKDVDKTFLEDFNTLPYEIFFRKYYDVFHRNYMDSLESPLILSKNEMWYEFPEDYLSVIRKRSGKYTLKWEIGQDRKKRIYITAQMMMHNVPNISLENLIYNLALERRYYYNNSDNKIDNQVLVQTAINAFSKKIVLNPSKHGNFKVNKEFWEEQGIGIRQAVGYVRRERRLQEILPYIDYTKSIPQNHKILIDNGFNISLRTLQRMVARGDISIVMGESKTPLLSKCHNATNHMDVILELIKNNNTITVSEIASILNVEKSTVQRNINKMRGVSIEREGNNRSGHWRVIDTSIDLNSEDSIPYTMTEFEWLDYDFETTNNIVENTQPMSDEELRVDMLNDGWTEQEVDDFFAIYAA